MPRQLLPEPSGRAGAEAAASERLALSLQTGILRKPPPRALPFAGGGQKEPGGMLAELGAPNLLRQALPR